MCSTWGGSWPPRFAVGGPTRVAALLRTGCPVLLDLSGRSDLAGPTAGWRDRVDIVTATADDPPAGTLLIRPDGHVAWADGPGSTRSVDELRVALATWFGQPADELSSAGAIAGQR